MTKASELVKQAYREINLKPIGQALTPAEAAEGLALLNAYIKSLFGFELGEHRQVWPAPAATTSPVLARYPLTPAPEELPDDVWPYPPSNKTVLLSIKINTSIFLDQKPYDGAGMKFVNISSDETVTLTIDANGRRIKGALVLADTVANLKDTVLFYRADLGEWTVLTTLLDTTESPFDETYDTLLQIGVAARLASRHGRKISSEQGVELRRLMKRLKTQYSQKVNTVSNDEPFPSGRGVRGTDLFR